MAILRTAVLALCAISFAAPGLADKPKIKVKDKRGEYEYEYEGPSCKFKYKFKYKDGKEEVEKEGNCPPAHALPQFSPPVPYRSAARPSRQRAEGFCDRALAGAIAGAVAGSAIGRQGAPADELTVGIVLGGVLGQEVGRRIGDADQSCMGRALAHAEPGADVGWTNPETGLRYQLRDFGGYEDRYGVRCRSFEMRVEDGQWREAEACQRGDGGWQLVELR